MKISFHGADQGVTGSCHLLECAGKRILVDCGMYQGGHELVEENTEPFGFDPASIDVLLLTHAHLDHCGRIPLLVKRGFQGEIVSTAASFELARLVLLDSAGLQEEEARYQLRRARRHGNRHSKDIKPLYTTLDALNSLEFFGRKAEYARPLQIAPGICATFLDAGHILGSASIFLQLEEQDKHHRLKHTLWDKRSSIVFVGYAAHGTLARRIIDGAKRVRIFGEEIFVHADIHTIGGFSAHADQAELLAWHQQTGNPKTTFLVHGEDESMQAFAAKLRNTQVEMPHLHQFFTLD